MARTRRSLSPSVSTFLSASLRPSAGVVMSRSIALSELSAVATMRCASDSNGRMYFLFLARPVASVLWRVHSWMERMAFQGSSLACEPSSMPLARMTSSSALSSGTRPISRRYRRTESSVSRTSVEATSTSASGSAAVATTTGSGSTGVSATSAAASSSAATGSSSIEAAASAASTSEPGEVVSKVIKCASTGDSRAQPRDRQNDELLMTGPARTPGDTLSGTRLPDMRNGVSNRHAIGP